MCGISPDAVIDHSVLGEIAKAAAACLAVKSKVGGLASLLVSVFLLSFAFTARLLPIPILEAWSNIVTEDHDGARKRR